jgi:hypothetical protein
VLHEALPAWNSSARLGQSRHFSQRRGPSRGLLPCNHCNHRLQFTPECAGSRSGLAPAGQPPARHRGVSARAAAWSHSTSSRLSPTETSRSEQVSRLPGSEPTDGRRPLLCPPWSAPKCQRDIALWAAQAATTTACRHAGWRSVPVRHFAGLRLLVPTAFRHGRRRPRACPLESRRAAP